MRYRRMRIEVESPEQLGYTAIRHNLAESSVSDMRLADYGIEEVFFETGRGPMPIREQLDLVEEWRNELGA